QVANFPNRLGQAEGMVLRLDKRAPVVEFDLVRGDTLDLPQAFVNDECAMFAVHALEGQFDSRGNLSWHDKWCLLWQRSAGRMGWPLHHYRNDLQHSDLVERDPPAVADLLEEGWCQARDPLELRAEMGHAGIMQLVRDLAQGFLLIDQQFLYALDLLRDEILLDGRAFGFRKQATQVSVFVMQALAQHVGQIARQLAVPLPHQGNDFRLDLADQP